MSEKTWFYVDHEAAMGPQKVGPIEAPQLILLLKSGKLGEQHYVWTKGMENWQKVQDVPELLAQIKGTNNDGNPPTLDFDWSGIPSDKRCFFVSIGQDRNGSAAQYGPYSVEILKKLFRENRINDKTLIYAQGLKEWTRLAEVPTYSAWFEELPPAVNDQHASLQDQRRSPRHPFLAEIFFHNDREVYEGVCRDISLGGMQVLVDGFPGRLGDIISLNVHPDSSKLNFVAKGKIIRMLDAGQGFALRFHELPQETASAIKRYIESESN